MFDVAFYVVIASVLLAIFAAAILGVLAVEYIMTSEEKSDAVARDNREEDWYLP